MLREEVVLRLAGALDGAYGGVIDLTIVRGLITEVLYDYTISQKETSLALLDNINNKIMLYLISKKTEGLSEVSLKHYAHHLKKFSEYMRKDVEDVTSMDIRMHLADYAKKGVKPSTIATRTDIIRGFLQWLEDEGCINKSPMKQIKTIKIPKRTKEVLTEEEWELLKCGATTKRQKALITTIYATGARREEIVNMNIRDINWRNASIVVIGKGDKQRTVYLDAPAQVYLKKYLESRNDDCEALFVTERRPYRRMDSSTIYREVKKIMQQSGITKNVFPHKLRSSVSSHLLNSGMAITSVQRMLGHSSPAVTLVYAQLDDKTVENEYKKYS